MFSPGEQELSIKNSVLAFVKMILHGPNSKRNEASTSQAALTIAQLLQFNCHKRHGTTKLYHKKDNETYPRLHWSCSTCGNEKKEPCAKDVSFRIVDLI